MPMRLGAEAAGVVSAVGADVTSVSVGDEVIAYDAAGRGITEAYTTDLVVPVAALTAKPAALSWPAAAGLMLTGAAATHAVTAAGLDAADTLLIHAASGGVGLMAVQLARARGATVIGTAPPAAHDLLREFGVVPVVYGPGLADRVRAAAPDGVTAALDLVGTDEAVDVSLELVADRRRIVTIAAFGRAADAGIVLLGGGPGADPGTEIRTAARGRLAAAAADGSLRVVVAATYPLDAVADAHRQIMTGQTIGKIALLP
jgi:NADPH:quinone reductase-like Zn-dependent oxidoreductase